MTAGWSSPHLADLGLDRLRFIDPNGALNLSPRRIIARRPGHMVHFPDET